jgi:hypothetical protein
MEKTNDVTSKLRVSLDQIGNEESELNSTDRINCHPSERSENMTGTNRSREMPRTSGSEKMWSNDIRQIVDLFHSQLHFGEVIKDPVDYVEALKPELRAAGPELKFLQLAVPDKKSPFGWKPTPRLMEFIAERKNRKKSKRLYEADIMWELLSDYAFGYGNSAGKGSVFVRELLLAIGVLGEHGGSDWVTEDFQILFDNGYYDKRKEDGLPSGCEIRHHVHMSAPGRALLRKLESRSQ